MKRENVNFQGGHKVKRERLDRLSSPEHPVHFHFCFSRHIKQSDPFVTKQNRNEARQHRSRVKDRLLLLSLNVNIEGSELI